MNLKEYMFYKGMTIKEFAVYSDLSTAYLSRALNGRHMPSAKTLRVIERVTKGKVKPHTAFAETKFPEGWEDEEEGGKAA